MVDKYYNVEMDGDIQEIEKRTKQAAIEWAENKLADDCHNDGKKSGAAVIEIVEMTWNEIDGEFIETARESEEIDYAHFDPRQEWGTY